MNNGEYSFFSLLCKYVLFPRLPVLLINIVQFICVICILKCSMVQKYEMFRHLLSTYMYTVYSLEYKRTFYAFAYILQNVCILCTQECTFWKYTHIGILFIEQWDLTLLEIYRYFQLCTVSAAFFSRYNLILHYMEKWRFSKQ